MKRLVVTAAIIALLGPALASAQERGDRGGGRNRDNGPRAQSVNPGGDRGPGDRGQGARGQGEWRQRGGRGADRAGPPAVQVAPAPPAAAQADRRGDRGRGGQGFQSDRRGDFQGDRRFDNRGGQPDRRFDNRGGDRGRDDRFGGDRRYDNRNYQRGGGSFYYRGRNFDRFRAQPYRWPGGYRGAYSWRPRQILPPSFLLPSYFIDNYYDFGFGPPPYGYEWVRVGDDALLVNIYTGEIIEVAAGVFYW